ncbi:penicillin-binding transpeptidase domain-containing protein [Paenibacillus sp. MMS18-CY102]|uniref:penicillin-binding transpeptidase domain-containing protein n=1 Tax=Paenibacillus sp. MMS18-CY102 TaxID=2682849 RepID=UPI001365B825|nr:penicillin-binding transpeptidase domain-containing protein [Paenibacillus sp. MMS18-CY102]MWC27448.1 PASTA domain-containing protein [Paenibacillus sp. MMS18-CY102]
MRKRIQLRVIFMIGGFVTLLFVILIGRLYWVQVVKADFWLGNAEVYWSASEKLVAKRGELLDRNGNVLAMDGKSYTVAVSPKQLDKLGISDKVSSKLAQLLGMSESDMRAIATAKNNGVLYPQREVRPKGWKIDKLLGDKIDAYKLELQKATKSVDVGIYLIDETKRYYPKNSMAAQLIGYVDKEGDAKTGLESFFNDELKGENGYRKYQKDGNRIQLDSGKLDYKPSRDGKNVTLTIDSEIQNYVEQAIQKANDTYRPKSITAIAVDPNTMEILGLANLPSANPNVYWTQETSGFYNHATRSLYEPGSTFKIVTLAAAVQEGIFDPNASYMSGQIDIGHHEVIRDIKRGGWGSITYLEGLKRSSNVAFVHLGYEGLGEEKLLSYITNFGFGVKTGVEMPGELAGRIRLQFPRDYANATFGQGVSVTLIQQVAAVAAVANGGKLLKPQIIKQIEDPITGAVEVRKTEVVRQVISPETSRKVGEYLEQVVSDKDIGTGKNAYIEGYTVAGKTGTAQKWDNTLKGGIGAYSNEKYVMSFIGYAPVENPKILVYVVIDEPNDKDAGGGKAAAPVFKEIVQQSLRYMGVKPQYPDGVSEEAVAAGKSPTMTMPDYSGMNLANAKSKLDKNGLQYEVAGKGATVLQQIPSPGTVISLSQRVYLITEKRDQLAVPNMVGSSLRDAMEVSTLLDIRTVTEGQGYVVSQTITKQNGERVLKLVLSPDVKDIPADSKTDADNKASGAESDKSSKPGSP